MCYTEVGSGGLGKSVDVEDRFHREQQQKPNKPFSRTTIIGGCRLVCYPFSGFSPGVKGRALRIADHSVGKRATRIAYHCRRHSQFRPAGASRTRVGMAGGIEEASLAEVEAGVMTRLATRSGLPSLTRLMARLVRRLQQCWLPVCQAASRG